MRRKKGSFRNGNKQGARANLHNFRSSGHSVKWNDQIAVEVAEKVEEKAEKAPKAPAKKKAKSKKAK